jgi:hypothetical protein
VTQRSADDRPSIKLVREDFLGNRATTHSSPWMEQVDKIVLRFTAEDAARDVAA